MPHTCLCGLYASSPTNENYTAAQYLAWWVLALNKQQFCAAATTCFGLSD